MATNVLDFLQPAGGGVPAVPRVQSVFDMPLLGGSSVSPATPANFVGPVKPTATPTAAPKVQDFSGRYANYNGTIYDKTTDQPFPSDAAFRTATGYSSSGQKFDTTYVPKILPANTGGPVPAADLNRATYLPDPKAFTYNPGSSFSDNISAVANTTLTTVQNNIDQLYKQREDIVRKQKEDEQAQVNKLTEQLDPITKQTIYEDAVKSNNEKFQIEDKIKKYTEISEKIQDATAALANGLVYEGGREARLSLISGRQATLKEQGLATIGALQGVAQVIKGNIDMANSYGNAIISAMQEDNQRQQGALQLLLTLHNSNLLNLTKQEQDIVNERITGLKTGAEQIEKNKDTVLELMAKYPDAFLKGNVTFLDTPESAARKMLPFVAERDRITFQAEIAQKNRANSGGTTAASKKQVSEAKAELLNLKANGMTYDEAVSGYGDVLDISYIAQVYGRQVVPGAGSTTAGDLYGNFINPDGSPKPGYEITLDSKGKPVIQKAAEDQGPGIIDSVTGGIKKAWNYLFGE